MFKTKLTAAFAGLLAMLLLLASSLYWSMSRIDRLVERTHLAHEELETYLSLSAETYRMFKQFRRILLDEGAQETDEVDEYRRRLERQIDELRLEIASEAAFIGSGAEDDAEQVQELARLALLTEEISQALDDVTEARRLFEAGQREQAAAFLSDVLVQRIDGRVGTLIDEAVALEQAQVAEIEAAADRLTGRMVVFAEITAVAGVLLAVMAVTMLLRGLSRPLDALTHGAQTLAAGDLSHRIPVRGGDEFAQLAGRFNDMASDLERQRQALQDAQRGLEIKVAERTEELRRANEALKQTDRIRRNFFAEISHELRTPLTVIRGEGEVSLYGGGEVTGEDYRESIKRMVEQAEHLGKLVEDLFLIARSSAGVADLRAREVVLTALTREVWGDARVLAAPKSIDLKLSVPDEEIMVMGDRRRLRQLLLILLDNAIRYSPEDAEVSVALQLGPDIVTLTVADQGSGIAKKDLAYVFDRFYRGAQGRRLSPEGSGLGLPLAKSIAEGHGGEIAIDSTEGAGTTVTVRLPALSALDEPEDTEEAEIGS